METYGSTLIGLSLPTSKLHIFLYNGVIFAILKSLGTKPVAIELFIINAIGRDINFAPSFKNRGEILSRPVLFRASRLRSSFSTYSVVTGFSLNATGFIPLTL